MATLTIDIPNAHIDRLKAVTQKLGPLVLEKAMPPINNPAAHTNAEAAAVATAMVKKFLRDLVKQVEVEAATQAASATAMAKVDTDGVIP